MSGKHASLAFMLSLATMAALAQSNGELAESGFVSALQGEQPQTIESFLTETKDSKTLSTAERGILKWISNGALDTESIRKAGEILDTNNLPSMEVESNFEADSEVVGQDSLEALGKALQNDALASIQILLTGHTDAKGDNDYNLTLSKARAEAVRSRLILEYGIAPDRIIAIGFGEERLTNSSDPESTVNRRVEIVNIGDVQQLDQRQ